MQFHQDSPELYLSFMPQQDGCAGQAWSSLRKAVELWLSLSGTHLSVIAVAAMSIDRLNHHGRKA
jgi:glycogen debranching enzyme